MSNSLVAAIVGIGMSDKPDEFLLQPDDIALTVFHMVSQPRSAWSFQVDLRPDVEDW